MQGTNLQAHKTQIPGTITATATSPTAAISRHSERDSSSGPSQFGSTSNPGGTPLRWLTVAASVAPPGAATLRKPNVRFSSLSSSHAFTIMNGALRKKDTLCTHTLAIQSKPQSTRLPEQVRLHPTQWLSMRRENRSGSVQGWKTHTHNVTAVKKGNDSAIGKVTISSCISFIPIP